MKLTEEQIHKQICEYIKKTYPYVLFTTDMSGVKLPQGYAAKLANLRSCRGMPDIMIFHRNSHKNGLFLEVKKDSPYKKDGELKKQTKALYISRMGVKKKIGEFDHLQEQNAVLKRLKNQGYAAHFVWSFDQAKKMIDHYIGG